MAVQIPSIILIKGTLISIFIISAVVVIYDFFSNSAIAISSFFISPIKHGKVFPAEQTVPVYIARSSFHDSLLARHFYALPFICRLGASLFIHGDDK